MKIRKRILFAAVLSMLYFGEKILAQPAAVTVNQDPKFMQLLDEKRRIITSITVIDKYKIQLFTGDSDGAKKALSDFRRDYKNMDGTIVFSTPTYKVWVGSFKSRIEAERTLNDIKSHYPLAFLIKPNK